MFERFDEFARRALFFSRFAVSELGGLTIEPEHLVLGILRESPTAVLRFADAGTTADAIRRPLERPIGPEKIPTSVEIPFSAACKTVLERTAIEADTAGNRTIGCEHMLLGVLGTTSGEAARVLTGAGVRIDAVRAYLKNVPEPVPETSVARYWKGVTTAANAGAYVAHLERETFPGLVKLGGFLHASIQKRQVRDGVEFLIVTVWRSLDAIKAFAGEDVEVAVVPPAAQALLAHYDERVAHYEIVNPRG